MAQAKTKTKTAAKAKSKVTISVRLPKDVVEYISAVAKLAGLERDQVINVIIAVQILREEMTRKEAAAKA